MKILKKNFFLVLVSLLVLIELSLGSDWEYWSHYEVKTSIRNNFDFKVKPKLRLNENMKNLYLIFSEYRS